MRNYKFKTKNREKKNYQIQKWFGAISIFLVNPHLVVLLEGIPLFLVAVPPDGGDVEHARPELEESAPGMDHVTALPHKTSGAGGKRETRIINFLVMPTFPSSTAPTSTSAYLFSFRARASPRALLTQKKQETFAHLLSHHIQALFILKRPNAFHCGPREAHTCFLFMQNVP